MAWWRRPQRELSKHSYSYDTPSSSADAPPSTPAPLADPPAPPAFTATFFTSAGDFSIRSVRSWSPAGVDRLYRLLREGHYNDTRVYRVVPSWVAQFGYSGDPALQSSYTAIADDPRPSEAHNKRGFISYSSAVTRGVKNSATERTTELFINLWDHWQLDWLGFTPIAVVVGDGMAVVNAFFNGYGEMADACNLHGFLPCDGPVESRVLAEGNAYLDQNFPKLTQIYGAAIDDDDDDPGRHELHIHLDGSIPPETLLRVAQRRGLSLPVVGVPRTVDDVWTALRSISPVWKIFDLVNEIIGGDEETLAEVAEDFVARQAAQRVVYTEVRWDPVRPAVSHLANASISVEAAVAAVARGLRAGSERHGIEVHQLLCAMRGSPGSACYAIADLAAATRSGEAGGVVGMDIAGDEYHFNNSANHVIECFRYAKQVHALNTTVHAGEMAADEYTDVSSAVEQMLADRIGHGYAAIEDTDTMELLVRSGVHLEACPAGKHNNLNATGVYRRWGLNFGLNTDDPAPYFPATYDRGSLDAVEALVRSRLGFTSADVARAHRAARAAAFAPDAARIAKKVQVRFAWENIVVLAALAAVAVVVSVLVRKLRRWRLKGPKPKRESNGIALAASDAARSSTAS